ncbi:MAG TPA: ricin-type beta-trefoil lectin domain protein [Actinocrinis sp.]|uniref:ricin-type beta-trefoil lectin domain protein n=1 Tax=Actinocrinis sp. TaxID=1920516 RepID=UPI002D5C1A9B|nr:ricin-type beta-trefoil lectin domain protein [Actinocrinis sp.]HZU54852.1 ricin-type beta-trefoil lectin domain protein [Actinocrinis sp.]
MAPPNLPLGRAAGLRTLIIAGAAGALAAGALLLATPAHAAGETVNIWLTTTNDSGGRNVTRGLQQQSPISFGSGNANGAVTVTVNENTKYQQFVGAGASMTDTAGYLLGSSGALTSATRSAVMTKLFDPNNGIGLDFLRNPMGASDLARYNYSYDDMPAGQTDPNLNNFSISHDLVDILPLTKQAEQLNPNLKLMMTPWSAPAWMKSDDNFTSHSYLQSQYYAAYAQYFVKTIQAYQAQGVHVDYVSAQNEPGCCDGSTYPTMNWNGNGLDYFTATDLLPALHQAGITSTKDLALDWNWSNYGSYAQQEVDDATVRNDSLFGGVAWHGYDEGSAGEQTTVHNQYPNIGQFDTEHSGGTWISNQQNEDMNNIIDYTRNWGQSVVKWSLAVDQNMGPHNGGCGTCTGLITVHNGDSLSGQVDYTVEYYDMGQLTKFVKPGAYRIDSTASSTVPNVAWINPDGSKALVAYNGSGSTQQLVVNWGNESFSYSLPSATSATFTWSGTQGSGNGGGGGGTGPGPVTGYQGLCLDVRSANSADGTPVQVYTCNGTSAQSWTLTSGNQLQALGKCLDVSGGGTANGTLVQLYTCNGTGAQVWQHQSNGEYVNPQSGKCLDDTGWGGSGTQVQIWSCAGGANQQWSLP